jgi:hypothetical protein
MSLSPTPKTRLIHIANIAWAKSTITVIGRGTQLVKSLGDKLLDVGWFIITLKSAYSQKWLRNAESRGDVAGGAIRTKYSEHDIQATHGKRVWVGRLFGANPLEEAEVELAKSARHVRRLASRVDEMHLVVGFKPVNQIVAVLEVQ